MLGNIEEVTSSIDPMPFWVKRSVELDVRRCLTEEIALTILIVLVVTIKFSIIS